MNKPNISRIAIAFTPLLLLASCTSGESQLTLDSDQQRSHLEQPETDTKSIKFTVSTVVPETPETLPVIHLLDSPPVSVDRLQRALEVTGIPGYEDDLGGLQYINQDSKHLYLYDDGAATYHFLPTQDSEIAIVPLRHDIIWSKADRLLTDLGLLEATAPWSLQRSQIRSSSFSSELTPEITNITSQTAYYDLMIYGLPTFGDSQSYITVGKDQEITEFHHNIRSMQEGEPVALVTPSETLDRIGLATQTNAQYNLEIATTSKVHSVEITDIELGYYVPDSSSGSRSIFPAYEIRGLVHGIDDEGLETSSDLYWLEPASPHHGLPSLNISPLI